MSNTNERIHLFAYQPSVFVTIAIQNEWFPTDLIRDLIDLIAQYFCVLKHKWADPGSQAHGLQGLVPVDKKQSTVAHTSQSSKWYRAWSQHTFGSGFVPKYFCVEVSGMSPEKAGSGGLAIGVSSKLFEPKSAPAAYGCDGDQWILVSACKRAMDSNQPHSVGLVGVTAGKLVTPLLTTTPGPYRDEASTGNGYFIASGGTANDTHRVGVVCDLESNQLTFYVDDKPVLATNQYLSSTLPSARGGANAKPNQTRPFVWQIPVPTTKPTRKLSNCYAFFGVFGSSVTAKFAHDWMPPLVQPRSNSQSYN